MAVVSSGSAQDSKGFKLATGPLKFKDVLICPTLQELNDYGVGFKEEPTYLVDDQERGKGVILNIWAKVDSSNFNAEDANSLGEYPIVERIYLFNNPKVGQSGSRQFTNKFGIFTYAADESSVPTWFSKEGLRPAIEGEEQLMKFIKAWGDVRREDECTLDTLDKICQGDFAELKEMEQAWKTHKFIWIVGLKDKGDNKFVPVVYNKEYWRVYSTGVYFNKKNVSFKTGLKEYFEQPYSEFNRADIITYEPKIWNSSDLKSAQPTPDDEFGDVGVTDSSDLF